MKKLLFFALIAGGAWVAWRLWQGRAGNPVDRLAAARAASDRAGQIAERLVLDNRPPLMNAIDTVGQLAAIKRMPESTAWN